MPRRCRTWTTRVVNSLSGLATHCQVGCQALLQKHDTAMLTRLLVQKYQVLVLLVLLVWPTWPTWPTGLSGRLGFHWQFHCVTTCCPLWKVWIGLVWFGGAVGWVGRFNTFKICDTTYDELAKISKIPCLQFGNQPTAQPDQPQLRNPTAQPNQPT